jgi:Icc-related predicted phosphoesterase
MRNAECGMRNAANGCRIRATIRSMIIIADVHDAPGALARVARLGEPLLILGDLANLIDYRTGEGIVAEVVGIDTIRRIGHLRSISRHDEASQVWRERVSGIEDEVRIRVGELMAIQYALASEALDGSEAYVIYGNVDRPDLLERSLPPTVRYVDAEVVEIEGWRVGFVGGGMPRIGTEGEISHTDMAQKLDAIGPVDVLCTHVPPAIEPLARDVIGRGYKGSPEIVAYLDRYEPGFHFFGDVHQPRAVSWTYARTECRNVGYFRATGRPYRFAGRDIGVGDLDWD